MPKKLSHYDGSGRASMVDVSAKAATRREAEASAYVLLKPAVLKALPKNPKGDPLEVARLAGIMAAKKTGELIPLCHPLPITHCEVEFEIPKSSMSASRPSAINSRSRSGSSGAMGKSTGSPPVA